MNILTLQDLAVLANAPYGTVYRHMKAGRINATRMGHQWIVTTEEAEAYASTYVRYGREGGAR